MSGCRCPWSWRSWSVLVLVSIAVGCGGAVPPPATVPATAPLASLDQKVAWILRLEQQRVLRDPTLEAGPGAPAVLTMELPGLVTDDDETVRARAALAIGRVGMADGVPLLVTALSDPVADVRARAAFGLGLIGGPEGREALEQALLDPSPGVRARAIEALGLIGEPASAPAVAGAAAACPAALAGIEPDDETWPMTPEVEICRLALFALVRLGDLDALASVALNDQGRPVSRWWPVAYALQRIGDPRAAAYLRPLLSSGGIYTPAFAFRGLSAVGDASVLPPALAIARQSEADPKLRVAAIRAIGEVGSVADAPALIALLADPALPTSLVVEVVTALGDLEATEAFDPLLELLTDRSPAVRAAALTALGRAGQDSFLLVLSGLPRDEHWSVRAALARVLGTQPADRVVSALEDLAADEDARVHGAALEALAATRGADAVPRLLAALEAPDFVERATAAELIGELKPAGGVAALEAAYERGDSDSAFAARGAALEALAAYGDEASQAVLRRALSDREWAVRWRAAELLHGLGVTDAEPDRPAPVRRGVDFFGSPEVLRPPYSPHAFVETPVGTIEIELDVADATVTARTFVEQARAGLFNGIRIHRLVPGFVVQTGDPRGDGAGGPGYTLRDELSQVPYLRGTVGIALDWRDTGGSQWFIALSPQPHLDARYTVVGRVVAGWDVLDRLSPWDVIDRVRIWDGQEFR